ncbi:hypothetical protein C5S36_04280 [Candidatus Methanophagaceae archaeon]|nr:hypothetical protein C5S36_04280 [Methanophagales archaeon]
MQKVPTKIIKEIAENIDCGMVCFINTETLETENAPQTFIEDPEEFEMITGMTAEDMKLKYLEWENYITVNPLESYEAFKIMEYFVDTVADKILQNKLIDALNRKKPFAGFNSVVDNSDYRQKWFDFKQQQLEEHVGMILKQK